MKKENENGLKELRDWNCSRWAEGSVESKKSIYGKIK